MRVIKALIFILFLTFSAHALAETKCKYFSQADVVNGELINKKEHYTCKENNQNFLVTFFTDPKYSIAAEQVYTMLYLATIKALGFN